jgi:peptidoglycan/xylan/chitin deacetylase (PgdA/CDA1 family)
VAVALLDMIEDAASEYYVHGGEFDDAGSILAPRKRGQTVTGVSRRALLGGALLGAAGLATGVAGTPLVRGWLGLDRLPVSGGYAATADHLEVVSNPGVSIHYYARTTEPVVAFTFDDGPAPHWTPMVLDELDRAQVPATFFMVGRNLARHPELVSGRLARHEVGNHSWQHDDLATEDLAHVGDDLDRTQSAIRQYTGRTATLFRPPYGHLGGSTVLAADQRGYDIVLWSMEMHENRFHGDPGGQARDIVEAARPGSIILAHDAGGDQRLNTIRGLAAMFDGLRRRGFRLVTVSEMLSTATSEPLPGTTSGQAPVRAIEHLPQPPSAPNR